MHKINKKVSMNIQMNSPVHKIIALWTIYNKITVKNDLELCLFQNMAMFCVFILYLFSVSKVKKFSILIYIYIYKVKQNSNCYLSQ